MALPSSSPKILLTRPRSDSQALAAALARRGFTPIVAPMLEIAPLAAHSPVPLHAFGAFLFTSVNAVQAFAARESYRQAPAVYAVGERTAQAARAHGFQNVVTAGGDSASLLRVITDHRRAAEPSAGRPMLHIRGEDVAVDLTKPLADLGIELRPLVVYRASPAHDLPPEALQALKNADLDAALFFSARAAAIFVELAGRRECRQDLSAVRALCLSSRVVKSLDMVSWREILVARSPDRESLFALLDATGARAPL